MRSRRTQSGESTMDNVVLLAVDGSAGSDRALDHALKRAKTAGSKLVVAFVIEWSPYTFNTPEENAQRHERREAEIERANEMVVVPALARVTGEGIEAEGVVRHGQPAETLIRLARDHNAAQIVIGRRGQGGLKSLIFGSVAG
ncbi:MAG TPA: universal stress protein, partial [Roseovarius nubinhibens]|nr:universal stress protein [Roseovarius nubinhibens]